MRGTCVGTGSAEVQISTIIDVQKPLAKASRNNSPLPFSGKNFEAETVYILGNFLCRFKTNLFGLNNVERADQDLLAESCVGRSRGISEHRRYRAHWNQA